MHPWLKLTDYLSLSCTPAGEKCVQMGEANYYPDALDELEVYKTYIEHLFPDILDNNCRLKIKEFPHDFGCYHELCIIYFVDDKESEDYAVKVCNNLPEFWDDMSIRKLKSLGIYKGKVEHEPMCIGTGSNQYGQKQFFERP